MPESLTVEIPMPPKQTHPNCPVGWKAKIKPKAKQREEAYIAGIAALAAARLLGSRPRWEAATFQATFYKPGSQAKAADPVDLNSWLKASLDSFTDRPAGNVRGCGILLDDNKLIGLPPIQLLGKEAGLIAKVVIVITKVESSGQNAACPIQSPHGTD